jgi:hypothetical protein
MDEIDVFMNEFDALLKKYSIDDVILTNRDDDAMGKRQLMKIIDSEDGKFFVMVFSGTDKVLCPCCKQREKDVSTSCELIVDTVRNDRYRGTNEMD